MSLCEYPSKIGGMQVEQLICLEIVSLRSIRESSMLSHGQCLVQPSIKSMFQMLTLEVVFNNIKNLTHHKSLGIPCKSQGNQCESLGNPCKSKGNPYKSLRNPCGNSFVNPMEIYVNHYIHPYP